MSLKDSEFAALRQTIATRGTARVLLCPATLISWAALTVVLLLFAELPNAALFPLAILAAGRGGSDQ